MEPALRGRAHGHSGNVELAFLGHTLEGFGRTLDPVLAVVAIGRKQTDHLVGTAGGRTRDIAGSEIDSLTNVVFVLQRPLHYARNVARPRGPACFSRLKNPRLYSTAPIPLASYIGT